MSDGLHRRVCWFDHSWPARYERCANAAFLGVVLVHPERRIRAIPPRYPDALESILATGHHPRYIPCASHPDLASRIALGITNMERYFGRIGRCLVSPAPYFFGV